MADKKEEKKEEKSDKKEKESEEKEESSPDYEKQIKDLQNTISEQGETIKEMQDYVSGSSVVINTLANDPSLRESFTKAFQKQYGSGEQVQGQQQKEEGQEESSGDQPQDTDSDVNRQVKDVAVAQRESIISDFEKEYGFDEMEEKERKEARQKVADHLNSWGWTAANVPLPRLRDSLEKAYIGSVGMEKLKEEGKLEGIAAARTNQQGAVGSFGGDVPREEGGEVKLTDKQQEWVNKLRVDAEKAKETYSKRDEERTREKKTD